MNSPSETSPGRRNKMLLAGMSTAIAALAAEGASAQGFYQYTATPSGPNINWYSNDHNQIDNRTTTNGINSVNPIGLSFGSVAVSLPGLKTNYPVTSVVFSVSVSFTGSEAAANNTFFTTAPFTTSFSAYAQLAIPGQGTYNTGAAGNLQTSKIPGGGSGASYATVFWSSYTVTLSQTVTTNLNDFTSSGTGNFGNISGLNFNGVNLTTATCNCSSSSGLEAGFTGYQGATVTVRYNLGGVPAPDSAAIMAPGLAAGLYLIRKRRGRSRAARN